MKMIMYFKLTDINGKIIEEEEVETKADAKNLLDAWLSEFTPRVHGDKFTLEVI